MTNKYRVTTDPNEFKWIQADGFKVNESGDAEFYKLDGELIAYIPHGPNICRFAPSTTGSLIDNDGVGTECKNNKR